MSENSWCFYYPKKELALQSGQFSEAARLADEASTKNLHPLDETEWVQVVIEYSNTGQAENPLSAAKEKGKSLRNYISFQSISAVQ